MRKAMAVIAACLTGGCGGGGGEGSTQTAMGCSSAIVVQMFGDSTQRQQEQNLQAFMDRRFGVGSVSVENLGASSTDSTQMRLDQVKPGAITVSNYGINDLDRRVPVDAFKAALRRANSTFYQTPNPPLDDFAKATREVAAEMGREVIDVSTFVRGLPAWERQIVDEAHPTAELYSAITEQLVGPAIAKRIETQGCKAAGA